MKIFFSFLFFTICATAVAQNTKETVKKSSTADSSYNIHATITPFKNCWMYLGSYYGKNKILVDSAWFNEKSEANFKGNTKLTGGIYFFVSPSHTLLFEIL